jgi:hypothetical protein
MRGHQLNQPIVGMAATPSGLGYWMVASDGGVFTFGDARFFGSTGNLHLNQPIVGMAATPSGAGYWLVAADGGIFAFGDAGFFGSTGNLHLNMPIVGMASPDKRGYWLVASDGGIFAFGDARFFGSTGNLHLAQPVVGMAATSSGNGYWLVASDGGIFSFGGAVFYGSTGGIQLARAIVGMSAVPGGGGYWLVASDGGIFGFGSAPFLGSTGGRSLPFPIIGMAVTKAGLYPPTATGFDISWPQCGTPPNLPPSAPVTVVGVNDGSSHDSTGTDITRNPCLADEAAWAGPNLTVYMNVDGVLTAGLPAAMTGPAGNCKMTDLICQGYNWGWDAAVRSIAFVHSQGLFPTVWWLDVESPCGFGQPLWRCDNLQSNAQVIQGALDGLHMKALIAGIYSTYLQFPAAVGTSYNPGVPIWIATVPQNAAEWAADCTNLALRFGGGTPWLIQWLGGFSPTGFDQDYACPQS